MEPTNNTNATKNSTRRNLLKTGLALAGGALLAPDTKGATSTSDLPALVASKAKPGHRKLGTIEVSSVGLVVQNMHRTYQTTIPYRPEMIKIIRKAYDSGVTLFDTAEAYGPFECERILGKASPRSETKL